jgi:arsenite-transporting ATPase
LTAEEKDIPESTPQPDAAPVQAPESSGPRIVLLTGKGGVGKTTIAAATAIRAAELGHKVLIMSSDPAHSLGDSLDATLGPEPTEVLPRLHAQEIDVYYSIQQYWGTLRQYVVQLFKWQQVDEVLAEEMAALPGMEEGATFLWVEKFQREGDFDLIVIDSAPTGETLKFLSLPATGQWWAERAFPISKRVAKAVGPVVRAFSRRPVPEEEAYEEAGDLYNKLMSIHAILTNPETSSIRLVVNPERMVIEESQRAYTSLQLYGYSVDAVIVNRVLPEEGAGPIFAEYLKAQKGYLEEIELAFPGLPVFQVPHAGQETRGIALLSQIGRALYEGGDPKAFFSSERPFRLSAQDGTYVMEIHLPFLGSEDVSVLQYGSELVVQIRGQRRNIFLPKFLGFYSAREARLDEGWLRVRFEKAEADSR